MVTSLAICEVVAGVPENQHLSRMALIRIPLTIVVLYQTIVQYSSHGNTTSGEVRVVVHALSDLDSWWGVNVTGKQGVDVILDV